MLRIDLASPDLKKKLYYKRMYQVIYRISFLFAMIALIVGVMSISSRFYLNIYLEQTKKESSLVARSGSDVGSKAKEMSNLLDSVTSMNNGFIPWSKLVVALSGVIPSQISLNSMNINKERSELMLSGIAKNRDDLILFRDNLSSLSYIKDLDFPLQNFLEKTDVSFTIKSGLDISQLATSTIK